MNMTIKIDGLFALVDLKSGHFYPRIFKSEEDAKECIKVIGDTYEIKPCFINN